MDKDDFYNKYVLYNEILAKLSNKEKINWNENFDHRFIYNSVAIEGNSCTHQEVTVIMTDGIVPCDKPFKEVDEIRYHQKAWNFAKRSIDNKPLDENLIKEIHRQVVYYDEYALPGEYRNVNVFIRNADFHPPKFHHLPLYLGGYYRNLSEKEFSFETAINRAAYVHAELTKIHPFIDGNGRTSRIIMNYVLMQAKMLPIAITSFGKSQYFDALEVYDESSDTSNLEEIIKYHVEKELELFLDIYDYLI